MKKKLSSKGDAQRKRAERMRMRNAGFVLRQVWVHPSDWSDVRDLVQSKIMRRKDTE